MILASDEPSLLNAKVLQTEGEFGERLAIAYLETGKPDVLISRRVFREHAERYAAALKKAGH